MGSRAAEIGWPTELLEGASAPLVLDLIGLTLPLGQLYERTELMGPVSLPGG